MSSRPYAASRYKEMAGNNAALAESAGTFCLPSGRTSDSPIISKRHLQTMDKSISDIKATPRTASQTQETKRTNCFLKLAMTQLHQLLLIQCSINEFELQL